MSKINKLIKISSMSYLIFALAIVSYFKVYGAILMGLGIIIFSYSFLSNEELKNKKTLLLILAIISIFINPLSAVILFLSYDELSSIKLNNDLSPPEDEISSETKRVDILLKIGLIMVLISGILFATTTWESISDIIKCLGLILMGTMFLGLSKFSELKLKIEKTTKAYYILGLFFFLLMLVGIGIFGTFSNWFSYTGEGKNLVYFCTFTLLSFLTYLIYNKFKQNEYKYISYSVLLLSLYHLLKFIGLSIELIVLLISTLTLIINIVVKDEKLIIIKDIFKMISYILWPIIILQKFNSINIITIISAAINIINIIYLTLKTEDHFNNITSIIISYILIVCTILKFQLDFINVILFGITTIFCLFINHNRFNSSKCVKNTNQIIYNVIMTITLFSMSSNYFESLICSMTYLLVNFISCYVTNKEDSHFDIYYQPIIILLSIASIFQSLGELINVNVIHEFSTCIIIYTLANLLIKDKKISNIYYIYSIIITILTLLVNTETKSIIASILIILSSVFIFKKEKSSMWSYILIILSILFLRYEIDKYISLIMIDIISIIMYTILTYIFKENIKFKRINLFTILIPVYSLINYSNIEENIKIILFNIYAFYILFLILHLYIKDNKTKDLLATTYTSIIIWLIIFKSSLLVRLYIGLVGIFIIFITYNKKNYKSLFYCGVIITILNIIIQLGEYWSKIPFWLYLLVVGIAIIFFVTNKELKKQNTKSEPIEKNKDLQKIDEVPIKLSNNIKDNQKNTNNQPILENPHQEQTTNFCPTCGNKNTGNRFCKICGTSLVIRK